MSCHPSSSLNNKKINLKNGKHLAIALAGNVNVFNQLMGSNQIIGNWPEKKSPQRSNDRKNRRRHYALSRAVVSIIQVK